MNDDNGPIRKEDLDEALDACAGRIADRLRQMEATLVAAFRSYDEPIPTDKDAL